MIWAMAASILFGINPTVISASMNGGVDEISQIFWTSSVNGMVNLLLFFAARNKAVSLNVGKRWGVF